MGLVAKDDDWRVSDDLRAKMEPLLPPRLEHPLGCHNPRVPDRDALNAILFVLRTGCQWNALAMTRNTRPASALAAGSSNAPHSWLNRFRRVLVRWEKRADTYLAMLHLACGLIAWRAAGLFAREGRL